MLDQMVESKDTLKESRTLLYLFSFFTILALTAMVGVGIWHLSNLLDYYQANGIDKDLVQIEKVEILIEVDEPPPVEEKVEKVTKVEQNVDVREQIIQDTMESPKEPDKIQVTVNTIQARRQDVKTVVGAVNSDAVNPVSRDSDTVAVTQTQGVGDTVGTSLGDTEKEPVIVAPTVKPTATAKPIPKIVSGGVVNGKARNLVTPQYPSAARAVRAAGQVSVQVTIDESGNVISANASSGHTLLRGAAESAARASKFNPTLLSGQPVKVTGIIIYNFVAP